MKTPHLLVTGRGSADLDPFGKEIDVVKFTTGEVRDLALLPADIAACIQVCRSGCWEWQGHRTGGYGRPLHNGRRIRAHRLVYELIAEPIPRGLVLDHLCRNKPCVNPAHLEAVTLEENSRRSRVAQMLGLAPVVPETTGRRESPIAQIAGERWLAVVGFGRECYEVSSVGRVKSLPRPAGHRGPKTVRLMKPGLNLDGRAAIMLYVDGTYKRRLVAQLVAEAFIGPRGAGQEIRHLDGNLANNCADNLAYGTHLENEADKVRHGTNRKLPAACPSGHEYTKENSLQYDYATCCKVCKLERARAWRAANPEKARQVARAAQARHRAQLKANQ